MTERVQRYEAINRTIEPYDLPRPRLDRDTEARLTRDFVNLGRRLRGEPSLEAQEAERARYDAGDGQLGRLGYDSFDLSGSAPADARCDSEDGDGHDSNAAHQRMIQRASDAWKTSKKDRLGPVGRSITTDPEPGPFASSSRATHGGGQRAIEAAAYDPPPKSRSGVTGEGALLGESEDTGPGGFGALEGMADDDGGSVEDAIARQVAIAKDAWKVPKKDRPGR